MATHARYEKKEDGFVCIVKGCKKAKDLVFDAAGLVEHLYKAHDIHPDEQNIDGWNDKFESQWQKYRKKKHIKIPNLEDIPEKLVYVNVLVEMKTGIIHSFPLASSSLPKRIRTFFKRRLSLP